MRLFLSSTFSDLQDERRAVLDLMAPGRYLHGMELFPADAEAALKVALRHLRACDAMLLVIGFRAGSVIPGRRGLTYTRAEFEFARRWGMPVFAFIKTEDGRWKNEETHQESRAALDRLKTDVEAAIKPDYFGNRDVLQRQVGEALASWEARGRPGARKLFAEREEYFQRPAIEFPLFDYNQVLRGRTEHIRDLNEFLASPQRRVAVLPGRGGIGKSKLLHDWTKTTGDWLVLFLKDRSIWHAEAAKEIPDGKVLVVVDDAHQSDNLEQAALLVRELSRARDIKILLAIRPSGASLVQSVLSRRFDAQEIVNLTELQQLAPKEVRELAEEVLGPTNRRYAPYLADISKDAPLATVVGGRLIAAGRIEPHLLIGTEEFRRAVFGKFIQEIEAVLPQHSIDFRAILHLVSALGPISFRAEPLAQAASGFLRLRRDEFLYGIDVLERHGLILRRGYTQRVAPDVLSDFLLEERCLNEAGESTGYAEALYGNFGELALSNLLRNLAELDWRVTRREVLAAPLLDRIWQSIGEEFESTSATGRLTLLQHVKPAASYQPLPILRLVRKVMDGPATTTEEGGVYSFGHQDILGAVPPLLDAIAYHPDFTEEAVRRLWRLAAQDHRQPSQFPEHAIRVLADMASYTLYKPVSFNMRMAEILDQLADEPNAFAGPSSPLDVVDVLLAREGAIRESVGLTIHLGGFELNYEVVRPVRERALAVISRCLYSQNGRQAIRALKSLADVIHGWIPSFGRSPSNAELKWQQAERLTALDLLKKRLTVTPLPMPLVREIYRRLDGFLRWSREGPVSQAIEEILQSIPLEGELFEFHMLCTAPHTYHRHDEHWSESEKHWETDLKNAVPSLEDRIPAAEQRVDELLRMYSIAEELGIEIGAGRPFVNELCANREFRDALTQRLLNSTVTGNFAYLVDPVLRQTRLQDLTAYLALGRQVADHPNVNLARAGAASLYAFEFDAGLEADINLLELFSRHTDRWVRRNCIIALQRLSYALKRASDPDRYIQAAVKISLAIDVGTDAELADELCEIFTPPYLGLQPLSEVQLQSFLTKLVPVHELDKHSIGQFLNSVAEAYPVALCDFLLARISRARDLRAGRNWDYRAVPYDFSGVNFHRLKDTDRYASFLRTIRDLVPDADFAHDVIELFWRVGTLDDDTLTALDEWIHAPDKVKYVIDLLSEGISGLAFSRTWFAFHLIDAASSDSELLDRAIGQLVWNAMPHMITGTPGQPPPSLVAVQERARQFREHYADLPLAVRLFTAIECAATGDIHRHVLEGEELDT